jgi:hypothetical protein
MTAKSGGGIGMNKTVSTRSAGKVEPRPHAISLDAVSRIGGAVSVNSPAFVSEEPVDLLRSVEVYSSMTVMEPKLKRMDGYLRDVHNMVRLCREVPGAYIPPSWMKMEQAVALAQGLGVKCLMQEAQ